MKSYEEMTEDVLNRARKEKQIRQHRKNTVITMIAGMFCLCIAILGVLQFHMPDHHTSAQNVDRESRMSFILRCSAAQADTAELIKDMVVPCQSMIRICDVTGFSETESEKAWTEAKDFAKGVFSNSAADDSSSLWRSDTAIISLICDGRLELVVEDIAAVEDMIVTATEMGAAGLGAADYYEKNDSIVLYWTLSDAAIKQIEKDPGIKMSTLSNTLTVKVKFKDGTTESATIDIIINDDGYVYAAQRGITVTS